MLVCEGVAELLGGLLPVCAWCGDENHQSNCTDKAFGCDREKSIDISDFPCFRFCLGTPERLDKVDAD